MYSYVSLTFVLDFIIIIIVRVSFHCNTYTGFTPNNMYVYKFVNHHPFSRNS